MQVQENVVPGLVPAEFVAEISDFVRKRLADIAHRKASLVLLQKEFTEKCGSVYEGPSPRNERSAWLLGVLSDAISSLQEAGELRVIGDLKVPLETSIELLLKSD
jgi:hypothetical protein